jgi:hypothetical protein
MSNLLTDTTIKTNIENITGSVDDFWLELAWEQLTNDLGYEPYSEEVTETYFGTNTQFLYLDKRPVIALSSIYINDAEQDIADYSIYKECAIESPTAFMRGTTYTGPTLSRENSLRRIKVTYTGGYTADNFPKTLQMAAASLIQNLQTMSENSDNLKAYSIADVSYSFKSFAETNEGYNALLDKYRGF